MPLRFNKAERDEWRGRMAGKSHTCEACCHEDCKNCSGTCDCSKCHGGKDASVLDALESKTADYTMGEDEPPGYEAWENNGPEQHAGGQCPMCGGPSTMLGQLGNRVHYRCRNCGADHSTDHGPRQPGEFQDFEGELGGKLLGPHGAKTAEVSMPPEGAPYQQKETALPFNPEAYEAQVGDMHPAAQYTYQRAVQQGADPQSAYQAAQEKQGEMGKRTQEGQNVEGVQIPVINTSYHGDRAGFVPAETINRVSHLL